MGQIIKDLTALTTADLTKLTWQMGMTPSEEGLEIAVKGREILGQRLGSREKVRATLQQYHFLQMLNANA